MSRPVRVFVSYSHQDAGYLEKGSLLGFLRGLEAEGVELWSDERITTGDLWDDEIKARIAGSDIALALVSQPFLDSPYCKNVEIAGFLAKELVIFPVILSPCEWQRHEWLRDRQFLPSGERTIEEHYTRKGPRKRLFLEIRKELRRRVERLRAVPDATPEPDPPGPRRSRPGGPAPNPFSQTLGIRDPAFFVGREAELRRLRAMLEGGSVALLGEPKIGKSSLLWQLARSWDGEVLGPIDLQAIEDRDDFYDALARQLGVAEAGWRPLRRALRERQALLLLDELDEGPGLELAAADLGRFRAVCGLNTGFKMVAVSRSPLKDLYPDSRRGSAVYNFLPPLTLGGMTQEEARCLLAHPWAAAATEFEESLFGEVLDLAGRHPFKLQRAAFHLYESLFEPGYPWRRLWQVDMEQML